MPEPKKEDKPAVQIISPDKTEKIVAPAPIPASALAPEIAPQDRTLPDPSFNFFARYQILIAGTLMLITVLSILGVLIAQRFVEKRDELKAIAAALRGELLAARAVCQTRLKNIVTEIDDRNASWPRLRATLYQAYVGRLGLLGAELARQVASIYGQFSDYAAYYNSGDEEVRASETPKRQALQMLNAHIEDVLPRLAVIEQTGKRLHAQAAAQRPLPVFTPDFMHPRAPVLPKPATPAKTVRSAANEKGEAPVTPTQRVAAARYTAAAETAAAIVSAAPGALWHSVQKLRAAFATPLPAPHDDTHDYTALIEQDIANMSFSEEDASEGGGESETPPAEDGKAQGIG
jgi:hypothetical protein